VGQGNHAQLTRDMALASHYPVVVVGTGPTGLVLAHLLARQGVSTLVIDRAESTVDEARAVTIDDESLRTLQNAGVLDRVLPNIVQGYGVHYYSWRRKLFARIEPQSLEYGYPKRNAFRQQRLVRTLAESLVPPVELRFRHELLEFHQSEDRVRLRLGTPDGERTIETDWLVGCDGGRSTVRDQLGIELQGSTYAERWLIADLIGRRDPFRHTRTFCDPARPSIRLPGPEATVRYEFMLHPEEDAEAVLEEARVRDWIREREPSDADITILRKVVYTFHARVATRWRDGRVLLAGDAAHLTPPFAGQGMNSGVRDAANLAWKLAEVVNGRASPALIDTYEIERKPHAWALINMALRIGRFMQPKSVAGAALAQGLLRLVSVVPRARDYILHLKFKPKPRFASGLLLSVPSATWPIPPGQLMSQPPLQMRSGRLCLLDTLLGSGFALVGWAGALPELPSWWPAGPVERLALLRSHEDFLPDDPRQPDARDASGEIARVLDGAGAVAMLLRPDRHILAYIDARVGLDWACLHEVVSRYFTVAKAASHVTADHHSTN
jgi:3-(3-hydroxy-phenyl)propionate hydroxylase